LGLSPIRIVAISAFVLLLGCSVSKRPAPTRDSQVLFVCGHGNVKSLMAASYFNQLVGERRVLLLSLIGVSTFSFGQSGASEPLRLEATIPMA
jgi:hypothetical protein